MPLVDVQGQNATLKSKTEVSIQDSGFRPSGGQMPASQMYQEDATDFS